MYRAAAVRSASRAVVPRAVARCGPRRLASTAAAAAPAARPRSWKSSVLRWAAAVGAVYYYNTSSVFADEDPAQLTMPAPAAFPEREHLPTVDAVVEQKRKQAMALAAEAADKQQQPKPSGPGAQDAAAADGSSGAAAAEGEDAGQAGAFNPETGEINWDCPCLGGMAHGPCGDEFKAAFSCFVYSTEEPKGVDCIEKFQGMQECFRKHPDVYGAELVDDEPPQAGEEGATQAPAAARDTSGLPPRDGGAADGTKPATAEQDAPWRHGAADSTPGSGKPEEEPPREQPAESRIAAPWKDATDANTKTQKSRN